ncbi:hypothetical protein Rsub_04640 [Raphidocelis subcapitata]|uniref:Uncharacterized protein n=1 Tax=Raphidocelis subcapitata TaxID=307507 RepID=A0A2V0NWB8_9CHLO|nr:hypothetical protein Rsub_04640 [Raphidocelis subcapitata]|eukprot:GBF91916.1 hypothetical protein Rsub_04640 [Raphidocelis subcapitata]
MRAAAASSWRPVQQWGGCCTCGGAAKAARAAPRRTAAAATTAAPALNAAPRRPQQLQHARRSVVAHTSEFWYEEEDEFDGLRELLDPKRVVLATPAARADALRGRPFVTAFASGGAAAAAEALWRDLGLAGPPLFLKIRTREVLTRLEGGGGGGAAAAAAAAADEFWGELLTQNWRTELVYGLGRREAAEPEEVLVVAPPDCLAALLAALDSPGGGGGGGGVAGSGAGFQGGALGGDALVELEVDGWNVGVAAAEQQQLGSWRDLRPRRAAAAAGRGRGGAGGGGGRARGVTAELPIEPLG